MSAGSRIKSPVGAMRRLGRHEATAPFFSRDDQDNEPIEYGVIAAGLTLALVVVLAQVGGALTTTF